MKCTLREQIVHGRVERVLGVENRGGKTYGLNLNLLGHYSETCQNRTLSDTETWFKRKIRNFRSLGGSFHDKKPVSTGTCETRTESGIYSPSNLLTWTLTL